MDDPATGATPELIKRLYAAAAVFDGTALALMLRDAARRFADEAKRKCASEEDCIGQPWCGARGECQRPHGEPQRVDPPPRRL